MVAVESVLTWLWQGMVVALLAATLLRLGTRLNASTRYLILWATLVAVLLLSPVTLLFGTDADGLAEAHAASATVDGPPKVEAPITRWPVELHALPAWLVVALGTAWAGFAGLQLHWMGRSLSRLRRIKRGCSPLPRDIEEQLPRWRSLRHQGRRASLVVSSEVGVACMLGLGRPMVVLPHTLVAALRVDQLDDIVVHEYAHVQRWDDWANLLQVFIEAVCGWHPSVWWTGRALRVEREVACDDWVIDRPCPARAYAACLARVADLASAGLAAPIAPSATHSARELTRRVERLLDRGRNSTVRPSAAVGVTGASGLVLLVAALAQLAPLVVVRGSPATTDGVPLESRIPMRSDRALTPMLARSVRSIGQPVAARPDAAASDAARAPRPLVTAAWVVEPPLAPLPVLSTSAPGILFATHRQVEPEPLSSTSLPAHPITLQRGVSWRQDLRSRVLPQSPPPNRGRWGVFADAGRTIGTGATQAGVAAAAGFSNAAAGFKKVFVRSR